MRPYRVLADPLGVQTVERCPILARCETQDDAEALAQALTAIGYDTEIEQR